MLKEDSPPVEGRLSSPDAVPVTSLAALLHFRVLLSDFFVV